MATVSQRKAAEALGMALSTLQHHIKRGNVTLIEGKVDVEIARMQLARNVDQDQSYKGQQNAGNGSGTASRDEDPREESPLWQAKTATERLREQILTLELAERRGELAKVADMEAAMAAKLTATREMLRSIADRLAPLLAAETDPIKVHQMVLKAIDEALRNLTAEAPPANN